MKIRTRALNKGETFCCSKKDVKEYFADSNITVNFGLHGGRHYDTTYQSYKKLRIKGKIIASLGILNIDTRIGTDNAMISFYVLKESEFSKDLYNIFVEEVLTKMHEKYILHKDGNPNGLSGTYYFRVELFNNEYLIHEGIEQ